MTTYQKINTIYKRDMASSSKRMLVGEWSQPEFEYLKDNRWEWTEKIDGTNIRVHWDGERVRFGGRTDKADIQEHLLTMLQEKFSPELMRQVFPPSSDEEPVNVTLYGEGYGVKIQKGGNYMRSRVGFILFDIKIGAWWLKRADCEALAQQLDIPIVPVVGYGTLQEAADFVKKGFKSTIAENKDYDAEGLVLKPAVDLLARSGQRIVAKIKRCDFRD
ncbi:MAG: RNA ligase family protein [Prevotellaceae bacterium]|nr:RNA ligase family protein [Prevotellaceae bacterium]